MVKKVKPEKPPAIDKLLIPAVGVVISFVAFYFMKGLNSEIPRIDVTDELALREIFFGEGEGKNHVTLCHTIPDDESKKALPISSVFQDAMDEITAGTTSPIASFALMDCEHTLPSGKKIHEKFKLNLKNRPTIFVSGKVGPPKQIGEKHLKTGHMLVKLLKGMLEPHAAKIESNKDFKSKCLNKDICALLLKGGPPSNQLKDAFKNLLVEHEDVQFASIDSNNMMLIGLEEYLPDFQKGQQRFVVFKKISGGLEAAKDGKEAQGRLITSILPLKDYTTSYEKISALVKGVKSGSNQTTKLSALPQVKTRSKKLEEQERAKKDRRNKKKEPNAAPSGSKENDGSKEGRRAERERRRKEQQMKNPNYREKTPEEIAEMERKRRERMQEEAEKWNVESEDAPPEGEYIEDEDMDSWVEEDSGEDDEDVLDLD